MNNWSKIVHHFLERCLPLSCYCELCLQPSRRDIALCEACEAELPWLVSPCQYCALLAENSLCLKCARKRPPYERLQALFDYARPVREFISALKYQGKLHFAKLLGTLMTQHLVLPEKIDCIIPMPLHEQRQCERGFNQSNELARIVARQTGLPLIWGNCTKIENTPKQSFLSKSARIKNVQARLFKVEDVLQTKRVLVIEDVVTTATTIEAFSAALKHAGVSAVEIWAVCRTQMDK